MCRRHQFNLGKGRRCQRAQAQVRLLVDSSSYLVSVLLLLLILNGSDGVIQILHASLRCVLNDTQNQRRTMSTVTLKRAHKKNAGVECD